MSKKIFFIVLTCCLLVATFCVSFAGAPQVQSAPADIRAVLDRPDCASAPLIVPPVVEPLKQWEFPPFTFPLDATEFLGKYVIDLSLPAYSFAKDGIFVSDGSQFDFTFIQRFHFGFTALELDIYSMADLSVPLHSFLLTDWNSVALKIGQDSAGTLSLTLSGLNPSFVNEQLFVGELGERYLFDFKSASSLRQLTYEYMSPEVSSELSLLLYHVSNAVNPSSFDVINHYYNFSVFYPYVPSLGSVLVGDIVDILLSGLTSIGEAMGGAFSVLAESIFINADGTGLSTFGILLVVFAAISLGLSLTRWVLNFVTSWGNRNR